MGLKDDLLKRANGKCELCGSEDGLDSFEVSPSDGSIDQAILICKKCKEQINDSTKMNPNHFRVLNDTMWSTIPAVQVVSYRVLKSIASEGWPQDLLDMLYLEPEVQEWADNIVQESNIEVTKDSNGTILEAGDSVTIIKDLDVKGAGFTAKRGTVVKNISLTNNVTQIEGRVNGVKIVLLSCFLKKS